MLATLITAGSFGAATQTACGRSARAIRWRDDRLLLAVLGRAEQLLAEVVVDRGVGRAADRARERDRGGAQALAAHEQLGRGGDERALAAAGAEDEAGAERRAQDAEHGGGVVRRRRVDGDLAREHDLLERARADPLDRARDRLDVVLGRRDAGDPEAPGGRGIEQRQLVRRAARPRGRPSARRAPRARRRARRAPATVRQTSPLRRASATSGTTSAPAPKPAQCGAAPPSGANAKPPTATSPEPGGPRSSPATAPPASSRQAAATVVEALGPARLEPPHARRAPRRRRRRARAARSRTSPRRRWREVKTTALGSTAGSSARSGRRAPRRRSRRARRTARAQRAASSARVLEAEGEGSAGEPVDAALTPVGSVARRRRASTPRAD